MDEEQDDIVMGKVAISSGPIWTVFATYASEEAAKHAEEVLRDRTTPRRVPMRASRSPGEAPK